MAVIELNAVVLGVSEVRAGVGVAMSLSASLRTSSALGVGRPKQPVESPPKAHEEPSS
jgi:hypothetical protein